MNYFYEMKDGERLEFRNEGNQTFVSFSSRGSGQQQSQGRGFTTGAWSKDPSLFRLGGALILEIHTQKESLFLRADGNQVTFMDEKPDVRQAEELPVTKSTKESGMKPMKPMKPMEPMKPMAPMKPM